MSGPTPAEVYESFFVANMIGPWTDILLETAQPQRGERVLDLACGTGVVARRVAPLVGQGSSVVGLDLRPGMLAVASALPPVEGASISWMEGDAASMELPDQSFDLVLCQQGLQFFEPRDKAAKEMARVLRPDGRAVVSVWRSLDHNDFFRRLCEVELTHLGPLGFSYQDVAAPFLMGDAGEIRSALEDPGFERVEITAHTRQVRFPSAEDFVANCEYAYGALVPEFVADPGAFEEFVANVGRDMASAIDSYREGEGLAFPMHAHIAVAEAPR